MLAAVAAPDAMNFTFASDRLTVHASGAIEEGDAAKFAALPKFETLELDSPGGLVSEALAMAANMDARRGIRTVVKAGALIAAIAEAKTSYPYVQFAQEKGTPSGAGESGMALTRFVAHLEFAALAGEGRWTLNKNNRSGTLIKAMEGLRDFLPSNFLPPVDQHPYSTYQRILTDARSEWDLGHFPWPKLEQKRRSR